MWSFDDVKIIDQSLHMIDFVLLEITVAFVSDREINQTVAVVHTCVIWQDQWALETGKSQDVESKIRKIPTILLFPSHKMIKEFGQAFKAQGINGTHIMQAAKSAALHQELHVVSPLLPDQTISYVLSVCVHAFV